MTRDLETAKSYFHERYAEAPDARYGLVASSRDKSLAEWGVPNDWHSTSVCTSAPGTARATTTIARAVTSASASPSSAPRAWNSTAYCSPGELT